MLKQERDVVAQNMYESYDFGSGVTVVEDSGWETDDSNDITKIVYVEFDDDKENSHRVSFHVKFKEISSEVEDVYGLLMSNGSEIGHLPKSKLKKKF